MISHHRNFWKKNFGKNFANFTLRKILDSPSVKTVKLVSLVELELIGSKFRSNKWDRLTKVVVYIMDLTGLMAKPLIDTSISNSIRTFNFIERTTPYIHRSYSFDRVKIDFCYCAFRTKTPLKLVDITELREFYDLYNLIRTETI